MTDISQGSVATSLMCARIYNDDFLFLSVMVKELWQELSSC